MNKNFFNRAQKYLNSEEYEKFEDLEEEFQGECEEIAEDLLINRKRSAEEYDLEVFLEKYYETILTGKYTVEQALEKYVLDAVYGDKQMNRKFNMKHFGSAANKLAKLEYIKKYMNNPGNYIKYNRINDPDYYDIRSYSNYANLDGYYESLENRIHKYRRMINKK